MAQVLRFHVCAGAALCTAAFRGRKAGLLNIWKPCKGFFVLASAGTIVTLGVRVCFRAAN